jgi:hypothetical protein
MTVEAYWMGKDLDLEALWHDFDNGAGYIHKVNSSRLHLLRLTFGGHPLDQPLFDHEVIYKTVKGTFHDVKAECFTKEAYDEAVPIFVYRIDRGSGIFEFLGQFDPLMTWVVALGAAAAGYRKLLSVDQEFDEKRLAFIRTNFPNASASDVLAYMKAWTTFGRRKVLQRLVGLQLERVELSALPHIPTPPQAIVNMEAVVELPPRGKDA